MLSYRVVSKPEEVTENTPVMVWLHGLGGNNAYNPFYVPDDIVCIAPNGPFRLNHRSSAFAWYIQVEEDIVDFRMLKESIDKLKVFIEKQIPTELGVVPHNILLAGFSQGGTVSTTFPLVHPKVITHSASFCGYIALDGQAPVTIDTVKNTRFFWSHGTQDWENPFSLYEKGVKRLKNAKADIETYEFDGGHYVYGIGEMYVWWLSDVLD